MLYLGFAFLLFILYLGSRYGGVGLGAVSGIGLLVEVFVFRMPPGSPPVDVMLIILAVVTCASILEAAGGLKFMLQVAERVLRSNPRRITFLGPIVTYLMTCLLGTGHAVYSIMPIIADIALKSNIRPERPMAAASIASQLGITASPISAAVVFYLARIIELPGFEHISLLNIMSVTVPSTLAGTLIMSFYSLYRGKELQDDPEYQRRLQDPAWRDRILSTTSTTLNEELPGSARRAVYLFLLALVLIVAVAMFPAVRTIGEGKPIAMSLIIQMMMIGFGGIILLLCKVNPQTVIGGVVFKSGMVAALAIFGIAWMSDTYFRYAMPAFSGSITQIVRSYPWTFGFALFAVSVVINSQAATANMLLPVGISLGLPAPFWWG